MNRSMLAVAAGSCIAVALTPLAHADGTNVELSATALFDEGRKLMAEKRYADACPKLAESERLAPSGGTLINLATCYEHTGQLASAWLTWKNVAARASAAGKGDIEKNALAHTATLEPSLAKLTIAVDPASDVPGLEIRRDGVVVGRAELGLAIPVDPGPHAVEATAPDKTAWAQTVDVAAKQTDARVVVRLAPRDRSTTPPDATGGGQDRPIPAEQAEAARPIAPAILQPAETAAEGSGGVRRTLGWVGVGVGGAGIVAGAVLGLVASSKEAAATGTDGCSGNTCPTATGKSDTDAAIRAGNLATYAFIAGGIVAAAGVVLVVTAPSGKRVQLTPAAAPRSAGLSLATAW